MQSMGARAHASMKMWVLLLAGSAASVTSPAVRPLSVLFIGNSYTFVNDVPGMVANISASASLAIRHDEATAGGASLFQHANTSLPNGRATMQLLQSQRWDAVVLQDQSETPGGGKDTDDALPAGEGRRRSMVALRDTFGPVLAKSGSHAILYQTWGRKVSDPPNAKCCGYSSFEGMSKLTAEGYALYSQTLQTAGVNVSTARCGDAWAHLYTLSAPKALDNRTIFSCLYNHNTPASQAPPCLINGMGLGGHPSPVGSYLNALVIFAQLFDHSPVGVWAPTAISAADKTAVQQAAAAVSLKVDDEQVATLQSRVEPLAACGRDQPVARPGLQTVYCDAGTPQFHKRKIGYTLAVPQKCVRGGCGVILDVHGFTMTAAEMELCDRMRVRGNAAGFIVVQPTAPLNPNATLPVAFNGSVPGGLHDWWPNAHHPQLIAFLRYAVVLFHADRNRVHISGYSQGGFASWNILCLAPDLICSAAPLEASGLDDWGPSKGYGNNCFNESGPGQPRPVLYTSGITDPLAQNHLATRQVENVLRSYGLNAEDTKRTAGDGYTEYAWGGTDQSRAFTYFSHDYNITSPLDGHLGLAGHCFPTLPTTPGGCKLSFRCCGVFDWTEKVLAFFEHHPCRQHKQHKSGD